MPLLVKICGLSTRETLDAALAAGATWWVRVLSPSPRHLTLEAARELGREAKGRAANVALTVDADDATLENIIEALRPDILQIHGKETIARVRDIKEKFGLPVMKAMAVETTADLAVLPGYAASPTASCSTPARPRAPPAPADWAPCSTGTFRKILISSCPSWSRAAFMPAMSRKQSASPAPAASMYPRASSARPVSKIPR